MANESRPNIQIDDLVREMTEDEYSIYLEKQALLSSQNPSLESRESSRQSALSKLAALGLTEEEIAAL